MVTRQNLHTHTRYCDGNNTPKEMIEAALAAGLDSLGFSGHSYFPWGEAYTMTPERMEAYLKELTALRQEYAGRIAVYRGLEWDIANPVEVSGLDFRIGAVHCVPCGTAFGVVDDTPEQVIQIARDWYGGDTMRLVRAYYEWVVRLAQRGGFQIMAHFDLITKFNEQQPLFDDQSPKYRELALSALDGVLDTGVILEVNTGGISRGYRKTPYPVDFLLRRIRERKGRVQISADAHHTSGICTHFAETEDLLRSLGFTEQMRLTEQGFVPVSLGN